MSNSTLICIYYPHQLIPAITAVLHYRRTQKLPLNSPAKLCVWSHQTGSIKPELECINLIKQMLTQFSWIEILCLDSLDSKTVFSSNLPVLKRAIQLRKFYRSDFFSDIFYAHDISSDFTAQVLMQAFPRAQRICYGDSLGLVYSKAYFDSLTYQFNDLKSWRGIYDSIKNKLAQWKRTYIFPRKSQKLDANFAVLAVPCDPGGDFLVNKKLLIPSRSEMKSVLSLVNAALPNLNNYLAKLLTETALDRYLLVLNNLTESKLSTRNNEVALYKEIIRKHVPKRALLVLKAHPGSTEQTLKMLIEQIKNDYEVLLFDPEFNLVPIELAQKVVGYFNILSLSYTSISLAYLFGTKVTHVLDDDLIQRYVNPKKIAWLSESNKLYLKMAALLKSWDESSVLYSGRL